MAAFITQVVNGSAGPLGRKVPASHRTGSSYTLLGLQATGPGRPPRVTNSGLWRHACPASLTLTAIIIGKLRSVNRKVCRFGVII